MNPYYAYSFLAGLFIGGYTNLFSKVVISSLVVYIVNPEKFHPKKFTPLYDSIYEKVSPYISKVYTLNDSILLITSDATNVSTPVSMKSPLPPLSYPSPLSPSHLSTSNNSTVTLKIK